MSISERKRLQYGYDSYGIQTLSNGTGVAHDHITFAALLNVTRVFLGLIRSFSSKTRVE